MSFNEHIIMVRKLSAPCFPSARTIWCHFENKPEITTFENVTQDIVGGGGAAADHVGGEAALGGGRQQRSQVPRQQARQQRG